MIERYYDINMIPGDVKKVIKVSQYDNDSVRLIFTLWNGTERYAIPSDADVFFQMRKPDGNVVAGMMLKDGSTARIDVYDEMTDTSGKCLCDLQVESSGRIESENFILWVEKSPE